MVGTKLIPYTVRVHPPNKTQDDDYLDLADLPQPTAQANLENFNEAESPSSLRHLPEAVKEFCNKYEDEFKLFSDESRFANTTLALSSDWDWEPDDQFVEGHLYLGNKGLRRSMLDTESGERDEDGRGLTDSEERRIYFLLYTSSSHPNEGYLLLERTTRYGAKGAFNIALRDWVNKYYPQKLDVKIETIKSGEIFTEMREAQDAVQLRFKKDGSPSDIHQRFDSVFESEGMKEIREFYSESVDGMGLIVEELESWYNESESAFETIDGTEYDSVTITVEDNGSEKTLSLKKGNMDLRRDIDMSEVINEGDLPRLPEISSRAHSFLRDVTGYNTGTSSLFK